jgi:glycosyltransferase involved in cell wall biosynthesis
MASLVFAGRLEPRKGVLELVEVCDHLWSHGRDFRLTLVGGDTPFGPRGMSVGAWLRWRYRRRIAAGLLTIHGAALAPEALWQRLRTGVGGHRSVDLGKLPKCVYRSHGAGESW